MMSVMRSSPLFVALLVATGCAQEIVTLDIPVEDGMKSIIVGIDQGRLRMFAYDLDRFDTTMLPSVEPFRDDLTIYALYYDETLEAVGLESGELAGTTAEDGLPLPDFDVAMQAIQSPGEAPRWAELELSGEMFGFRLEPPPDDFSHCFELGFETFEAPPARYWGLVRMSDTEVFAFGEHGTALRISPTGFEVVTSSTGSGFNGIHAATQAPGGDIYLGDLMGNVWRGHPDRGFTIVHTFPEPVQAMSVNPNPTEEDVELFALTFDNAGHRFYEGEWESSDGEPTDINPRYGEILRTGFNQAAVIPMDGRAYVYYASRSIEIYGTRYALLGSLVAATVDRAGRVVIVNRIGSLLEGTATGVRFSRTYETAADTIDMTRFGDGFVYIRGGGGVVYGELDKPQCPVANLGTAPTAFSIQEMNEDLVVAMLSNTGAIDMPVTRAQVLLIRRIPPN